LLKGGRPRIDSNTIKSIAEHLNTMSEISANRFLRKEQENANILNVTLVEAFSKYENKDKISFSTFVNYIPPKFKPALKPTDLCNFCEKNKVSIDFFRLLK